MAPFVILSRDYFRTAFMNITSWRLSEASGTVFSRYILNFCLKIRLIMPYKINKMFM